MSEEQHYTLNQIVNNELPRDFGKLLHNLACIEETLECITGTPKNLVEPVSEIAIKLPPYTIQDRLLEFNRNIIIASERLSLLRKDLEYHLGSKE